MPFLFIDYDQGMGGEYFCLELSKSLRCVTLDSMCTDRGRVKIQDKFNQEWLKPNPDPEVQLSDPELFDLVPCHRHTEKAKKILQDVRSIRLAAPSSLHIMSWIKDNQRKKVMLDKLPSTQHFFGELKILQSNSLTPKSVAACRKDMDYATLFLISRDIEPTMENKVRLIKQRFDSVSPEPKFAYDLVIDFEELIFDRSNIINQINLIFDLGLSADSLQRFQKDYFHYALDR